MAANSTGKQGHRFFMHKEVLRGESISEEQVSRRIGFDNFHPGLSSQSKPDLLKRQEF
jgi:hypothetical protein